MNMKLRNRPKNRNTKYRIAAFVLVLLVIDVLFFMMKKPSVRVSTSSGLPTYTVALLSRYDGSHPELPVLLAMDGLVYDVSRGRNVYYAPGKPYHMLAGIDASALLHIAGGDIIAKKYPIVGRIVK